MFYFKRKTPCYSVERETLPSAAATGEYKRRQTQGHFFCVTPAGNLGHFSAFVHPHGGGLLPHGGGLLPMGEGSPHGGGLLPHGGGLLPCIAYISLCHCEG